MKIKLYALLAFVIVFILGTFLMYSVHSEIDACLAIGFMVGLFAAIVTNGFLTPLPEESKDKNNKEN